MFGNRLVDFSQTVNRFGRIGNDVFGAFAYVFFKQSHARKNAVGALFNNRNLIFQRTADIVGVFGNAVADVEKFIFLMFKQQINGFSLFVKGANDVGNIADRVFGNRIEHG